MSDRVVAVRAFNRSWTEVLGLLDAGLLATEHSLAEARVIFELAQQPRLAQSDLRERLVMDPSFLSRVAGRLESRGLIESRRSSDDARAQSLELTRPGREAFGVLDARSAEQISELLAPLTEDQQQAVVEWMAVMRRLFRPGTSEPTVEVRELRAGDMGWVIGRHGAIYEDEFGWNADFEGLVAGIVADYHATFQPGLEDAWIATVDGARAGCVFCCRKDGETAQLRILLVESWARGLGLGRLLVDTCVDFARDAGYRKVMLWTNDVLVAARNIYQAIGFQLVDEEPHHSFGHDLVGQNWELELT